MNVVLVYLRLYGTCMGQAFAAVAKNAWTLALPMGLAVVWVALAGLVSGAGIAGGILVALARSAAFSAYTFFVAEIVARQKVSIADFKKSIGRYFWSYVNLFFVLWIVDLLLGTSLAANPRGPLLLQLVAMMELVVLNAAPEVIYQRGTHGGLETIARSFKFLQQSWIEWFIPNALVLAAVWFAMTKGGTFLQAVPGGSITFGLAAGALFHLVMVFRGFLFEALDGSSHRQRMFRYRKGSE